MATSYRLSAATALHKGDREYQQDQVSVITHPRASGCLMAVIADGMGGRSGGRKAADQVQMTARQLFERYDPSTDDATTFLVQVAHEAHVVIRLTAVAAEQEPHSTLAAFLINPSGECYWIHAGDSRVYQFKDGKPAARTQDHSYVQSLVNRGELRPEQAENHPQSNILLSCLGMEDDPSPDVALVPQIEPGDVFMACSDGLWHYFNEDELGAALHTLPPREACEFLVQKARSRAMGGGDNLSIAVVKVEALEPPPRMSAFGNLSASRF